MMRAHDASLTAVRAVVLVSIAVAWGCDDPSPSRAGPEPEPERATGSAEPDESPSAATFGEPIVAGRRVELADLVGEPGRYEGTQVRTSGVARRVCTRKGCWMELATRNADDAPGARVTFKDYGFFVPTDSAGAPARVQATVRVKTVPAEDVAHLESEGARFSDKAEDGTAREVHLVATGVEMDLSG